MSKQSEAREAQGYRHEGPRCGTCRNFTSELVPIPWMVEQNERHVNFGKPAPYDFTLPANNREANLRCGVGKFAIKKSGYCKQWEGK